MVAADTTTTQLEELKKQNSQGIPPKGAAAPQTPPGSAAAPPVSLAPGTRHLTPAQLAFLQLVVPPALDNQRAFGVPAAITIAQAILESATSKGWGTSQLFLLAHNPFGIKYAHRQGAEDYGHFDASTWEIVDGEKLKQMAQFQRFPDLREAFAAHALLLLRKRCVVEAIPAGAARVADALGPWEANDQALIQAGKPPLHANYSTNPEYPAELMKLVSLYRLDDPRALHWFVEGRDPLNSGSTIPDSGEEKNA